MNNIAVALLAAFAASMIPMAFGSNPAAWTSAHIAVGFVLLTMIMTLLIGTIISACSKRSVQHRIHRSH